jgi:hypothetical protein
LAVVRRNFYKLLYNFQIKFIGLSRNNLILSYLWLGAESNRRHEDTQIPPDTRSVPGFFGEEILDRCWSRSATLERSSMIYRMDFLRHLDGTRKNEHSTLALLNHLAIGYRT